MPRRGPTGSAPFRRNSPNSNPSWVESSTTPSASASRSTTSNSSRTRPPVRRVHHHIRPPARPRPPLRLLSRRARHLHRGGALRGALLGRADHWRAGRAPHPRHRDGARAHRASPPGARRPSTSPGSRRWWHSPPSLPTSRRCSRSTMSRCHPGSFWSGPSSQPRWPTDMACGCCSWPPSSRGPSGWRVRSPPSAASTGPARSSAPNCSCRRRPSRQGSAWSGIGR